MVECGGVVERGERKRIRSHVAENKIPFLILPTFAIFWGEGGVKRLILAPPGVPRGVQVSPNPRHDYPTQEETPAGLGGR